MFLPNVYSRISKKKKIIFTIFIFGLLFFLLNIDSAKAQNCINFCNKKCPLPATTTPMSTPKTHFDDTTCRKIGSKGDGYLCSCCTCDYITDKKVSKDVKCDCFCQGDSENPLLGNKVTDCYTGGLFQSWRTSICACCGDCSLDDVLYIGVSIAENILKYLGVIALALFVLGGIIWITSGGSKEKIKKGTAILKGAIVGMIIVIVAYSAVRIIMKDMLSIDEGDMSGSIPESESK